MLQATSEDPLRLQPESRRAIVCEAAANEKPAPPREMLRQPARLRRWHIPTGCPTEARALLPLHPPALPRSQHRSVRETAKTATVRQPQIPRPKPQSDAQRRHEARIAGKGPTQAQPARPAIAPPRRPALRRAQNQRMWRYPTRQDLPKPKTTCAPRASLSPALLAAIFFIGRCVADCLSQTGQLLGGDFLVTQQA